MPPSSTFWTIGLLTGLSSALSGGLVWLWCQGRIRALQAALQAQQARLQAEQQARLEVEEACARRHAELERSVQDQRAELELIYSTAPVGLCVLDRELRWLRINRHLAENNGFPPEAHMGRTVHELLPSIAQQAEAIVHQVMDTGQPRLGVQIEGETPAQPGLRRHWIEHFNPLRNGQGEVVGVNVVCEEVTDRLRAEVALREADQRKDEFLAMLAHELRNPLAPLRNGLEILPRVATDSAVAVRTREMMGRQLTHMVRLIDDLLDISRIRLGKLDLRRRPVSVRDVIDTAIESSQPAVDAARHQLTTSIPDEPLRVDGDATRLAQVVANLLQNAAKYTPDGGRINLTVRADPAYVRIVVTDNGIGIAPEMLPNVFDLFTQGQHQAKRTQGGLGIGLSLARRLVSLHGGTLEAHSAGSNHGSTFTVTLPLAGSADMAAPTQAPLPAPRQRGLRVLVADDNVDAGASLAMMLELDGATVMTARSGSEALDALSRFQPDVVFCDIGMPGLSGLDVARRVRANPSLSNTLLIAASGWGSDDDKRAALEAGFDGHLTKPVSAVELQSLLQRHRAPR